MFYKLSVLAMNNRLLKRAIRKSKKILGKSDRVDDKGLIKKYVPGKSFADIGCMWGVHGAYSFFAEESGAKLVKAVDVYPESVEFLAEMKRRNSKIEFVRGDINLTETTNKIGMCDVVFCSGVLYHTPDPLHMLTRLRAVTKEILILNTASIPELPGIKNASIFYPYLEAGQRKIWNKNVGSQKAITGPYEPESGYGNWFWGMTPSCLESMLRCVGFEVVERVIFPFHATFVCKAIPSNLVAESGEWTTPKGN